MDSKGPAWSTTTVALGFIVLVGFMFGKSVDSGNFADIWTAAGTIVGIVTGAIPGFFFAHRANEKAEMAEARTRAALLVMSSDEKEQFKAALKP